MNQRLHIKFRNLYMKKEKIANCQCAQCGKPKYKKPANLKLYPLSFCNKECLAKYKTTGETKECHSCNKKFYRRTGSQNAV